MRDRIRKQTRRTAGRSLDQLIAALNPVFRGWFAYFKHADRGELRSMDDFVRRRLRAVLRKQ